jgi:YegS/Rv2252/BmrU family lipid kinase
MPARPALVICNLAAGRGRVRRCWPEVREALHAAAVPFEAAFTREPGDATTLAEQAPARHGLVVAVGGDGTVHEVANGLLRASGDAETMPLAIVPLGGGDDFVKAIGRDARSQHPGSEAADRITAGRTALYDAARLRVDAARPGAPTVSRYFVNVMDVGLGAQTLLRLDKARRVAAGTPAYVLAAIASVCHARPLPVRVQLEGRPVSDGPAAMVAVANGPCFGGGFWICPEARADDGLLDVLVARASGRLALLRLIPTVLRGAHAGMSAVQTYRTRQVTLEMDEPAVVEADGQILSLDARRVEVDILPRRLRLII